MLTGALLQNWPAVFPRISAPRAGRAAEPAELSVAGVAFTALANGALWRDEDRLLIVADLHLEKGSAFARRGQMLPPYDTAATLAALTAAIFRLNPSCVVALGDSFHDNEGARTLADYDRTALRALQSGRDWIWIAGNHDDDLPPDIGGELAEEMILGRIELRHEPTDGAACGEIAGHLHPAARVAGRGGSVRRRCFAGDGDRLVLPAFGAYAGGLNVLDRAFANLFGESFSAFVIGADAVYRVASEKLRGD
jgi:DNA ligase-associated metallophosphoesterase